ncbi:SHOCT domain-containing protein [Novosphingobium lentum]|uniref:SHOCT domain-containing protein n=1 Tax=Novosphingobium lentum TaxID=145287 RepID=UPI0008300C6B|nr:SHOCT domain-containing protein [Novosphingobium lentum]
MQGLSEDGRQLVEAMASRHGVSTDAVTQLLMAIAAGGGRQAQFHHPDLGGMGQWSQGGMIMVGDMFNNGLKFRVDALCNDLAAALQASSPFVVPPQSSQSQSQSNGASGIGATSGSSLFVPGPSGSRWPEELGAPASTGSQNDLHYAVFPATHRLAIDQRGRVTVYDTADHRISGFSQQQSGDQSITFTSQHGLVRVADLAVVSPSPATAPEPQAPAAEQAVPKAHPAPAPPPVNVVANPAITISDDEIFSRIERLADLRKKDIITAAEFEAKKAELLARL